MQRLFCATMAALVVSGGLALAQSNNPYSTTTPGAVTPAPSNSATTGRAPGVNPANPQDMTRRSNPQDMTLPGARNPQDMRDPGTPAPPRSRR